MSGTKRNNPRSLEKHMNVSILFSEIHKKLVKLV